MDENQPTETDMLEYKLAYEATIERTERVYDTKTLAAAYFLAGLAEEGVPESEWQAEYATMAERFGGGEGGYKAAKRAMEI
jgi:hypothetical protein